MITRRRGGAERRDFGVMRQLWDAYLLMPAQGQEFSMGGSSGELLRKINKRRRGNVFALLTQRCKGSKGRKEEGRMSSAIKMGRPFLVADPRGKSLVGSECHGGHSLQLNGPYRGGFSRGCVAGGVRVPLFGCVGCGCGCAGGAAMGLGKAGLRAVRVWSPACSSGTSMSSCRG